MIEDNGPGISDEALTQLGNPFYTDKDDGMGIGITLSHHIIEKHHGTLQLTRGKNNHGTVALIKLPIKKGTC
jgi:C4-dicarboxylate-specific signal transduction histidine kinase